MTGYPVPLPPVQLRRRRDPSDFPFADTTELIDIERAVGQTRALETPRLGLTMTCEDFNIFALGPPGLGKMPPANSLQEWKVIACQLDQAAHNGEQSQAVRAAGTREKTPGGWAHL
jgi:hypothetical protein